MAAFFRYYRQKLDEVIQHLEHGLIAQFVEHCRGIISKDIAAYYLDEDLPDDDCEHRHGTYVKSIVSYRPK